MKRARTVMKNRQQPKTQRSEEDELGIRPVGSVVRPRSWAVYGRSGSGKTTFASTFPRPILMLDIRDQGNDSISDQRDIDEKEIETFDDIEDVYYFLKKNPKRYKTVVFDTVTQLQQMLLEEMSSGKRRKNGNAGDWGTMTKRDWGDVAAKMKEWIMNFRNLPMEVVFLAQERVSTIEEEEVSDNQLMPEVGPQVMPSVAGTLNAAVSVIGNTFVGIRTTKKSMTNGKKVSKREARYRLRVGPNPVYTTKLRKPKKIEPPAWIDNPTYADVIAINKGED